CRLSSLDSAPRARTGNVTTTRRDDRSPVTDQVLNVAAFVFNVPRKTLTPRTTPRDVAAWDSVNHLALILALEQQFGIAVPPEDTDEMDTLEKVVEVVERRLALRDARA